MRRVARLAMLSVVVVAAMSALPGQAQAAVSPGTSISAVTMEGASGNSLLGSGSVVIPGSSLVPSGTDGALDVDSSSSAHTWRATLAPPTGAQLQVGTYAITGSADLTHAGFDPSADSRGCSVYGGSITIHEMVRDAGSAVTAFAASYSVVCGGQGGAVEGELRWQSSVDYVRFGSVEVGKTSAPQTVTVNAGDAPLKFGTVTLGGERPTDFSLTANTCSGVTVPAGGSCALTLTGHPSAKDPQQATAVLADGTTAGRIVPLTVVGAVPAWGTYKSLASARILDTRTGLGATKAAVRPGGVVGLQVLTRGGIPSAGVSAVVLNLTATAPTASSYLTAWANGGSRPTASNINFVKGASVANLTTVPIGAGGKINIYNNAGTVQVIADVVGYYVANASVTPGGFYQSVTPERLLDSRDPSFGVLRSGDTASVAVSYHDTATDVDANPHIHALAVNITAVSPSKAGYFVSWSGIGTEPLTSTLNFIPGQTTPNMAVVPVAPCMYCTGDWYGAPSITVRNMSVGSVHILIDIVGFYDDGQYTEGLRFKPLSSPTRILDTRIGLGTTKLGAKVTRVVHAPASVAGVPTWCLVTNTTAVSPTLPTYLTMWAVGDPKPLVSNLNPAKGKIVANAAITGLGMGNNFNIYNDAGATDAIVDVLGTMEWIPTTRSLAATKTAFSLSPQKAVPTGPTISSSGASGTSVRHTAG